jgi:hypothetical protein
MPILPSDSGTNAWKICFSIKVDGETRYVKEDFIGTIREAMSQEMRLRGQAKEDRSDSYAAGNNSSSSPTLLSAINM